MIKGFCARCGNGFTSVGNRPKTYCSARCYHEQKADNGKIVGDTKECARCQSYKQFSDFPIQPTGRAGVGTYCKECSSAYFHNMRGTPVEKRKKYAPRVERTDEEKRARRNERSAAARKKYAVRIRMSNRLRHQKVRAAGKMPDRHEIGLLLCEQDARCAICSVLLSGAYHIDHKNPVSRGGTNDIWNLQILCVSCNTRKSNKTDAEYRGKLTIEALQ